MKRPSIQSMKKLLEEFKAFILKGNVVQLAVAVVMGAAFGAVVKSAQEDLIGGLLANFVGTQDFASWAPGKIRVGAFLNSIVTFLITSLVVFFVIVKPMNRLMEMFEKPKPPGEPPKPPATLDDVVAAIKDLQQQMAQMQGAQPKIPPPPPGV